MELKIEKTAVHSISRKLRGHDHEERAKENWSLRLHAKLKNDLYRIDIDDFTQPFRPSISYLDGFIHFDNQRENIFEIFHTKIPKLNQSIPWTFEVEPHMHVYHGKDIQEELTNILLEEMQ